jgi:YD repeat-containing protein
MPVRAPDGVTFAPDGSLYAAVFGQSIVRIAGTNAPTPGAVTTLASVPSSDGTAVAASSDPSRPPFIFANRNDGIITRIDLTTTPPTLSTVASGGTRGDFVAVGPDGCLYATQTSTLVKVTNADGTCSLAPTGAQPQLSLSPATVSPSPSVGTPVTFSASLLNVANPAGRSVTFTVTGANPQTGSALANSSGVAAFTYTTANSGTDTVVATANVGGAPLTSNPRSVTWVRAEPHSLSVSGASPSFAESPASADLNLTGNWTVEFWLRDEDPNGFDHEFRYLINKGDGVAAESPFYLLLGNGSPRGNSLTVSNAGITHSSGKSLTFNRDGLNRITRITDPAGNLSTYTYNAAGDMTSVTDALNNSTTFTYDAQGNKLTATDPAGHVANFTYDAFGNLTQQRDTLGHTTTFVYDAAGRRTSVRDPLGNTTSTTYDAVGNPLITQDALGNRAQRSYDLVGNLATFTDPANNTTQLLSNVSGLPQQTTAPDGSRVVYQYDPNSNISGTTTATGLTPAITRNKVGNPTDIAVAPGIAVSYQYDAKGRKIAETDARGNTTSYVYNVLDKVTQRTDALGAVTRYTYDAAGSLLSQTDPNTNTTGYVYDADNRLVRTNLPGGSFLTYAYNSVEDMTAKQDPAGSITTFTYDNEGNLLSVRDALGSTTSYVYDAGGNLVTMTDALNRQTTYLYDALHHMTRRTYPDGTTEQMTYTATGEACVAHRPQRPDDYLYVRQHEPSGECAIRGRLVVDLHLLPRREAGDSGRRARHDLADLRPGQQPDGGDIPRWDDDLVHL